MRTYPRSVKGDSSANRRKASCERSFDCGSLRYEAERIKAACDAAPTLAMRDGIGSSFLKIIDFWLHWDRINCVRVFENCLGRNEVVPVLFSFSFFFFECDGPLHFTPVGIKKDRIRSQWLNPVGIEVIRFTSDENENDTQGFLSAIDVVLKRLPKQDAPPHPPTPSPPEEKRS